MSTIMRADCDENCAAEDRVDCFEMEHSTVEELWQRVRDMMAGLRITRPEGVCSCSCHDEFDEPDAA